DHRFSSVKIETVPDTGGCPGVYFLHARRANGGDAIDETFLAKLDYGLNALWAKIYNDGVSEWETFNLVADANGDVIISGLSTLGSRYGTLTKIDGANGLVLASNGYQTAGTGVLFLNVLRERIAAGTPNFVVVGGYTSPNTNNYIGGIAKINATTWVPSWSKQFEKTGEQVLFTGLAQLQANNGDLYTGYFTPDPANPGFFKPRLLRVASGNGTFKKYRDLGGLNTGLASDYLQIGANGAARLFNTTGRPGTIGGGDGYLYELGSTMIDACGTTVTQATVNMPLTKTALPLDVFDVLQQVVVSNYCSPSTPVWGQDQPPCPPHGNKPANGEGQNNTLTRNPELDLFEQVLTTPFTPTLALNPAPSPTPRASGLGFEIFPNPAAETLEITLDLNEETPETEQLVQIFDAMGKLVKTHTAVVGEQTTLDLGDLPKGIYSVKVGDSPAQKLTKL
ncbi:MAG: T9SS type A sorting domain-containing protein, partial [Saprospiraceae bacterium]